MPLPASWSPFPENEIRIEFSKGVIFCDHGIMTPFMYVRTDPGSFPFENFDFAPVIRLPETYEVYDFSKGYDPGRKLKNSYGIGRYDEVRPSMYTSDLFMGQAEPRNIHLGIDIAAPVGECVYAFADAVVHLSAINSAVGDYGGTIILEVKVEHESQTHQLWALFGHLSHKSVEFNPVGRQLKRAEAFAFVGDRTENGGWNPHLHFQLSVVRPEICDLPGTATASGREAALRAYPDPRLILGQLY